MSGWLGARNSPLWDRRCQIRISGPLGGPEARWILSVGWCPSKRVVVIHHIRPYTAQKVSGGCAAGAISGGWSCLGRMHSLTGTEKTLAGRAAAPQLVRPGRRCSGLYGAVRAFIRDRRGTSQAHMLFSLACARLPGLTGQTSKMKQGQPPATCAHRLRPGWGRAGAHGVSNTYCRGIESVYRAKERAVYPG
jgi:hypothetical protein